VWYGSTGVSRISVTPQGWHITNYSTGQGIPQTNVYMIYQSADSTIWCATTKGVFYYSPQIDRFLPLRDLNQKPIQSDTRSILVDSQGDLWLGTNGSGIYHGTYIATKKGWKFQNYTTQNGLAGNRVFAVMEDREHNLWFGTWGNGISKLVHNGFINFTWANGQPIHSVYGLFQDHQKNIWFGTDGRGALLYQDGQFKNFNISSGLKSNSVWYITSDRAQNVWFCTLNGLACFRPKTGDFRHFSTRNGLPRDNVLNVHEDRQGHFWLGTSSYGILIYQHNPLTYGLQSQPDTKHFLDNNAVYSIYETRAGTIWLGSTNGAYLFKDIPQFISQLAEPALKLLENIFVWCIFEDEWNRIWFGTNGNGLINFTGDTLRRFTKNDGLCDNTVYFIQPDNQKNCWLGTNRGIQKIQLTPDSLIILQNYDSQAGLASNETNVNCSILDARNRLWFGTVEGVSQFVLEESTTTSTPPLIYIKSVRDLKDRSH
jgi:ligand-binding sensor domain-containing protein